MQLQKVIWYIRQRIKNSDNIQRHMQKIFVNIIYGNIRFRTNMSLLVQVWDDKGVFIEIEGPVVENTKINLNRRENKGATSEQVIPFIIKSLSVEADKEAYLPIGELNLIRRKAVEELIKVILEKSRRQAVNLKEIKIIEDKNSKTIDNNKEFNILLRNINDIEYAFHPKVKRIYLDINKYSINDIEKAAKLVT